MNYPEWIDKAETLYKQNIPYCKIAKELNVNRKAVSYYLRAKGYTSNPKYVRKVNPDKLRKFDYTIADNVFDVIDTEEKAYWLGFLYADGYISNIKNTISLSLKESDKEHVKAFRSFLHLDNKKLQRKIKDNKYISYSFSFDSAKAKKSLISLGCFPNKSKKLKFPNEQQVPTNLIRHFIRGYIDGDGCITNHSTSKISLEILGTEDFLAEYQKRTGLHLNKIYSFKHSDIKRSIYSGKYAIQILEWIYHEANIFLARKYNKYQHIIAVSS